MGNPGGVPGDLLRAEGLVVRPRLLPLLRRRLEIAEMRLDAPAVTLVRSEQGDWSFDRLVTRPAAPAGPGGATASVEAPTTPAPPSSTPLDVVVPRLAVSRGTLAVTRERRGSLVAADGIEITTSLSRVAGAALAGEGQLAVESLRVGERVEVRSLTTPLKFAGGDVTLAPIRGQLGGRRARGPGDRAPDRADALQRLLHAARRPRGGAHGHARRSEPERPAPGPGNPRRHGRGHVRSGARRDPGRPAPRLSRR